MEQGKLGEIQNLWSMTKKWSSEILADENREICREKIKVWKFSTESENFSKIGGNLKQWGEMHHGLRGWTPLPIITCSLPSPRTFANSSPSSQPALLDHHPVSPFLNPRSPLISCFPTEPYPSYHCTTSLERTRPTIWAPHHFFTSTTVIANHKTSSSSASSIRQPPGLPLHIKMSYLQTLLSGPIWSCTFFTWTTSTLTATLSPPGILEIGPELLLTPFGKPPFDSSQALVNKLVRWCA